MSFGRDLVGTLIDPGRYWGHKLLGDNSREALGHTLLGPWGDFDHAMQSMNEYNYGSRGCWDNAQSSWGSQYGYGSQPPYYNDNWNCFPQANYGHDFCDYACRCGGGYDLSYLLPPQGCYNYWG